ncbi:acyl carrier protein [Actinomadura chibensis]|uniref:Acyl carrier protein n=1 Tax=Actinomadura chibensis TaxID=392828 RepID=A0A5D0NWG8_9ACTN|nr:acyl carrier protein [Actinomadura chibensis]TYB48534.1 acyl carrier protein [Actinomadura chibensis]
MNQAELTELVARAIENTTGRPSAGLDPDTTIREAGVSSIDLLRFVTSLEELLCRDIPEEHLTAASFATVGSTVDILRAIDAAPPADGADGGR